MLHLHIPKDFPQYPQIIGQRERSCALNGTDDCLDEMSVDPQHFNPLLLWSSSQPISLIEH